MTHSRLLGPDLSETVVALVLPDDAVVETDSLRLRPEYDESVVLVL